MVILVLSLTQEEVVKVVTMNQKPTNQMPTGNRSPKTRRRTVAALVAGVTLSASLAAAGALGLTGHASAVTTLSGTTYVDENRDGLITVDTVNPWLNDKRLGGITISVFDATGTKVGTTASGTDGNWQLTVEQTGPFRVEFASSVPNVYPGFTTGGGDVQFTNGGVVNYGLFGKLNGLGEVEDLLGKVTQVQIGNRVWLDSNANGIQDPGEAGINGVTVELALPNGAPATYENGALRVTTTSGDGNYEFGGLPQNTNYLVLIKDTPQNQIILGSYRLTIQAARTGLGSNQNDSDAVLVGMSAQITAVTPPFGADLDFDFGYKPAPVVTTTTTLPEVTTTTVPETTTTTVPETTTTTAPVITTTTTPVITTTTVPATTTTTATPRTYCLGDLMFDDLNADGIRQTNEPGVVGQTVFAFNAAGANVGQSLTDANGGYTICGLAPGAYTVSFTKPANSSFTKQLEGNDRNNANSAGILPAVTITNANILTADAGIVRNVNASYCLGDFVWIDQNQNGMQDFLEPGVSGVPVTVLNASGAVVGTATTDANGAYKVCGLAPGSYTVRFTAPSGLLFTNQYADSDRAKDSDANSVGVTGTIVIVNADVLTVDAGLIVPNVVIVVTTTSTTSVPVTTTSTTSVPVTTSAPATTSPMTTPPLPTGCLGDKVFVDASGRDNDGRGIPGVTITLVKPDGTTSTALTDGNGNYTFCSLTGGRYTVRVNPATLPKGSLPSYDLNGTKNNETTVALPTGQSNRDVDFGYVLPIVNVKDSVIEQPTGDIPAFTGSNTTTQILWGLSFLLMGFGIVGLAVDRRRYTN